MMRLRFLFGFVLLAASATPALAVLPPEAAVSPYVRDVLIRANTGIAQAQGTPNTFSFLIGDKLHWRRKALGSVLSVIDTRQRLVKKSDDLLQNSLCLRSDLFLLEQKMLEVQDAMEEALNQANINAIFKLEDVLFFLYERYDIVLKGAKDASVRDDNWYRLRLFEPVSQTVWCSTLINNYTCEQRSLQSCEQEINAYVYATKNDCIRDGSKAPNSIAGIEPDMCPFTSDYQPPIPPGFGCDSETMARVVGFLQAEPNAQALAASAVTELQAMSAVETALQNVQAQMQSIQQVQQGLGTFIQGGTPTGTPPPPRRHKTLAGCFIGKICRNNPSVSCSTDTDCNGNACIPAKEMGSCSQNVTIRCQDDSICQSQNAGTCNKLADVALQDLRGPFSLEKDQVGLLTAYRDLAARAGANRDFSTVIQESRDQDPFSVAWKMYAQNRIELYAGNQSGEETVTLAISADQSSAARKTLDEFKAAVKRIGALASDMSGIRGFVRDFAYFLRRSCMDRPCNKRLESILKIVFANECFPYTNGAYLSDTEQDQRWQKCMREAFQ